MVICTGCSNTTAPTPISFKDNRTLSVAVTTAQEDNFDRAFTTALEAGMQATNLALSWDDLETAPGAYAPEPNFLAIANTFYPTQHIKVALEINPIDTSTLRLPKDLQDKPFDDPMVIERYQQLLDWAFEQVPDLEVTSLTIGNEIDAYMGDDPVRWQQYQTFFEAVAGYARTLDPDLNIGTKATFNGLTETSQEFLQRLNRSSDVIMATYYPLEGDFVPKPAEVVHVDFEALTTLYEGRPIYLLEIGYPSGTSCGSSEEQQAAFIEHTFEAWDVYHEQIQLLSFTWLTDLSPSTIEGMVDYYGVENACFAEFLATLGLRTHTGDDKKSFTQLKQEVDERIAEP